MLIILLTWIFFFITTINFGVLFREIFKIKNHDHFLTSIILGSFGLTILSFLTAFFIGLDIAFFLFLVVTNAALCYRNKYNWTAYLNSIRATFVEFPLLYKFIFIGIFILTLGQSATAPYLLDNESYYVQTIKWLDTYGFVQGVANLHPFYGQHSGWHVLQSALNFSFIGEFFNDINGYIVMCFSFFSLERLNQYWKTKSLPDLIIGLLTIFNVFFFQFVSSPSPDVPIFLFSQLLFYLFIKNFGSFDKDLYLIVISIVYFLLLIKITPIALAIIPMILFVNLIRENKEIIIPSSILGALVLFLFIFKNYLISGYLMFPGDWLDIVNPDWKIPKSMQQFYYANTEAYSLIMNAEEYAELGFWQKMKVWVMLPKLSGLFNKTMLVLIAIVPILMFGLKKNKKSYLIIYGIGLIHLLVLFATSAQYRFYFNFFIFFLLFSISAFGIGKKLLHTGIILGVIISAVPLFIPIQLSQLTDNKFAMNLNTLQLNQIIQPHKNSKYIGNYSVYNKGNIDYSSPIDDAFFWNTGDGQLPCTNKNVIEYFEYYFGYLPQKRTDNLKDGFKSVLSNE